MELLSMPAIYSQRFDKIEGQLPQPLIPSKPLVIIAPMGASGYEPGGPLAHMNFLEPHPETIFKFIGLAEVSFVRVGFEEFKDGRFKQAMADAERAVQETVDRLWIS